MFHWLTVLRGEDTKHDVNGMRRLAVLASVSRAKLLMIAGNPRGHVLASAGLGMSCDLHRIRSGMEFAEAALRTCSAPNRLAPKFVDEPRQIPMTTQAWRKLCIWLMWRWCRLRDSNTRPHHYE